MQTPAQSEDVLYFSCGDCGTELSVPLALHGVEGPCPACGLNLKAPSFYLPEFSAPQVGAAAMAPSVPTVYLPPLDRRHDQWQNTESIPVPEWMNEWQETDVVGARVPEVPEAPQSGVAGLRITSPGPGRWVRSREAEGFRARHAIPPVDEPMDDSWEEKHRAQRQKQSNLRKLDRAADRVLQSKGFRIARVTLLVATGGLCAGLVLFMQDRNWVVELPWRPDRAAGMVATPPVTQNVTPVQMPENDGVTGKSSVNELNPFLVEDASDLEGKPVEILAPLPDPVSVPVGAQPSENGNK